MGLSLANLTPELSQRYGLTEDAAGVVVTDVEAKSQAAEKGVRAGDVIVEVVEAGRRSRVRDSADLTAALDAARKSGDKALQLLIGRQGDLRLVALKLDQGSARPIDLAVQISSNPHNWGRHCQMKTARTSGITAGRLEHSRPKGGDRPAAGAELRRSL